MDDIDKDYGEDRRDLPECGTCNAEEPYSWALRGELLCLRCAAWRSMDIMDSETANAHEVGQAYEIISAWAISRRDEAKRRAAPKSQTVQS